MNISAKWVPPWEKSFDVVREVVEEELVESVTLDDGRGGGLGSPRSRLSGCRFTDCNSNLTSLFSFAEAKHPDKSSRSNTLQVFITAPVLRKVL